MTNNIWGITEDRWGNIWVGVLGGGAVRIDKHTGKQRSFTTDNSVLKTVWTNSISTASNGWIMLGNSEYFALIHPRTFKIINGWVAETKGAKALTVSTATSQAVMDSRRLIWLCSPAGVAIFDRKNNQTTLLDMKSGLHGSNAVAVTEDNRHTMWVTTDHGVSNIIPQHQEDSTWTFVVRSYNDRDGLQPGLILFGEAAGPGAVDIENADDLPANAQGNDDFGIGGAVTGDVAGEKMHVRHEPGLPLLHRRAADAAPDLDLDAGGLPLEGAEDKAAALHEIEARPVEILQPLKEKGRGVCEICDPVRHPVREGFELRAEFFVIGHGICAPFSHMSSLHSIPHTVLFFYLSIVKTREKRYSGKNNDTGVIRLGNDQRSYKLASHRAAGGERRYDPARRHLRQARRAAGGDFRPPGHGAA